MSETLKEFSERRRCGHITYEETERDLFEALEKLESYRISKEEFWIITGWFVDEADKWKARIKVTLDEISTVRAVGDHYLEGILTRLEVALHGKEM